MKKRNFLIFCLSLLLCASIGMLFFTTTPKKAEAAANSVYDKIVTVGDVALTYKYAQSGKTITLLNYGTATPATTTGTKTSTSGIDNGKTFSFKTESNKNGELYFVLIPVRVTIPARTTYAVDYSFDYDVKRYTSNNKATAEACAEIVYLGDLRNKSKTQAEEYLANKAFTMPTKDSFAGLNCGDRIASGHSTGKQTYGYSFFSSNNGATKHEITYNNSSYSGEYIVTDYFGFWMASQYGSSYANNLEATLSLSANQIKTTARVIMYKDDAINPFKRVGLSIASTETVSALDYKLELQSDNTFYLTEPTLEGLGLFNYDIAVQNLTASNWYAKTKKQIETSKGITTATLRYYTVSYDTDGGTITSRDEANIAKQIYLAGSNAIVLNISPSKIGYKFVGWYNNQTKTLQACEDRFVITKTTALTAVSEPLAYNVTLNGNGGKGTELNSYTYGKTTILPTDWKKQCSKFEGWYDSKGNKTTEISATETGDKEFAAKWSDSHTVVTDPAVPATCTATGKTAGSHCSVCNKTFKAQTTIAAKGHSKITVTDELPSFGENGLKHTECLTCKEVLTNTTIPALTFETLTVRHNCSFGNDLSMLYAIPVSNLKNCTGITLTVEKDYLLQDGTTERKVKVLLPAEYAIDGVLYYRFDYKEVSAKEIGDTLTATLAFTKNEENFSGEVDVYSLKKYAEERLTASSNDVFRSLLVELLNYGAAAQVYFDYNTEKLANADLTEEQAALSKNFYEEIKKVSSEDDDNEYEAEITRKNIKFGNRIELLVATSFGADSNLEGVKLKVVYTTFEGEQRESFIDGSEFVYRSDVKSYTAYFDGLKASEFRNVLELTILRGDEEISATARYSLDTYSLNRLTNSTDDNYKKLLKQTLIYSDSAKSYFEEA